MTQPIVMIQARNGGSRLPGKINMLIEGQRMLDIIIARARQTGLKWMLCRAEDYREVAEEDVLGRFQAALESIDPGGDMYDPILRVTADCPLWEPQIAAWALHEYQIRRVELVHTGPEWDGLDVEVISRGSLARAHRCAQTAPEREHVTLYTKRYGRWCELPPPPQPLRFSVDDQGGLEFVRRVFKACALCIDGVPHHSNAAGSIGGSDRQIVWDLHHLERGDLAECWAYDILKERMGGEIYLSP